MPALPQIDGWVWQFDKSTSRWSLQQTHGTMSEIIRRLTATDSRQTRESTSGAASVAADASVSTSPASVYSAVISEARPMSICQPSTPTMANTTTQRISQMPHVVTPGTLHGQSQSTPALNISLPYQPAELQTHHSLRVTRRPVATSYQQQPKPADAIYILPAQQQRGLESPFTELPAPIYSSVSMPSSSVTSTATLHHTTMPLAYATSGPAQESPAANSALFEMPALSQPTNRTEPVSAACAQVIAQPQSESALPDINAGPQLLNSGEETQTSNFDSASPESPTMTTLASALYSAASANPAAPPVQSATQVPPVSTLPDLMSTTPGTTGLPAQIDSKPSLTHTTSAPQVLQTTSISSPIASVKNKLLSFGKDVGRWIAENPNAAMAGVAVAEAGGLALGVDLRQEGRVANVGIQRLNLAQQQAQAAGVPALQTQASPQHPGQNQVPPQSAVLQLAQGVLGGQSQQNQTMSQAPQVQQNLIQQYLAAQTQQQLNQQHLAAQYQQLNQQYRAALQQHLLQASQQNNTAMLQQMSSDSYGDQYTAALLQQLSIQQQADQANDYAYQQQLLNAQLIAAQQQPCISQQPDQTWLTQQSISQTDFNDLTNQDVCSADLVCSASEVA